MVSFIIPAHNEEQYIKRAIDSIYKSIHNWVGCLTSGNPTPQTFEIILIDDASSDNTYEVVSKTYPDVKIIKNPERKGSATARNIGIKASKGEFICFIDADVWLEQNCISELLKHIQHYDIVYTVPFLPNGIPIFPIFAARNYPVITALFMIKKDSLNKVDSFDEIYEIYNEDLDFFLRCRMFGLTSKYVESAKAYHWLKTSIRHACKNPEFRYYMDLRNSIYGYLKFYKLGINLVGFGTNKIIIQNIARLLCNKDVYNPVYCTIKRESNLFLRIWYKIFPKAPITRKTRLYLIFLIFKVFLWNFTKLKVMIKEHNKLRILNIL